MLCTRWSIDAAIDRTAAHIPLLFFCATSVWSLSLPCVFVDHSVCIIDDAPFFQMKMRAICVVAFWRWRQMTAGPASVAPLLLAAGKGKVRAGVLSGGGGEGGERMAWKSPTLSLYLWLCT